MTEQNIQQIINSFNSPQKDIFIAYQEIGRNVVFAKVWDKETYRNLGSIKPYQFYLILNDAKSAIGAVLDMDQDLHWYIEPDSRKQGYLTRALQSTILPHLARTRKRQEISISRDDIGDANFKASETVARKCGFRKLREEKNQLVFVQSLTKYRQTPIKVKHAGLDFEELTELRKDINEITARLAQIQATVAMQLGESRYTRELQKTVDLLSRYRIVRLEDALDYFKNH
jgi:RimJ/RimL family protein N-acetyltransferase